MAFEIIFKNTITESITIQALGITIAPNEASHSDYEDLLALEDSQELINFILSGLIVVNDGTNDLSAEEAVEYLQISSEIINNMSNNFYTQDETDDVVQTIVVNNITQVIEDYYTKGEVDGLITSSGAYGIKGAVDFIEQLPETGLEGEIYIVRGNSGDGDNQGQYIVNDDTILYVKFEDSCEDEIGNHSEEFSPIYTEGKFSRAILLNSSEGHCRYTQTVKSFNPPELSGGVWIYSTVQCYDRYNPILHMFDYPTKKGIYLTLKDGKPKWYVGTTACHKEPQATTKIGKNIWTHIGFTFSASEQRMRVFINGLLNKEYYDSHYGTIELPTDKLYVGYNPEYNHGMQSNFRLDELFLQEGELTESDFQNIINGSAYQTINEEGFYTWDVVTSAWVWLANNTSGTQTSGSSGHPITQSEADELTLGNTTELHNHDSAYYTEIETDNLLTGYSTNGHNHNSSYYLKTEIDDMSTQLDYTVISSNDSNTNVTGAELEMLTNGGNADGLHTHNSSDGDLAGNGLDDAYDNHDIGQNGVGRTINADSGSVTIQASNGYAPLRLSTIDYKPVQDLVGGEICHYDGDLFTYDSSRSKWVSTSTMTAVFGRSGDNRTGYMRFCAEVQTGSSYGGFVAPWDCVIVGISVSAKNDPNSNFEVRINNTISGEYDWDGHGENSWNDVNTNFNKDERVTIKQSNCGNKPDYPIYILFIKRRIV